MPAVQVQQADTAESAEEGADVIDEQTDGEGFQEEAPTPTVTDHLEMALEVAAETGMSTSELMGIFFYYAHSIAESYRQEAIGQA